MAHQICKVLKRQNSFLQPFDGNLLQKLLAMPNDEDSLVGIDTQIHVLADPIQVHIVASFADAHRSILANLTHEMLPMDGCQPSVGINRGGKRR